MRCCVSSLAMTKTLKRASGWVSEAKVPSEAAMRMRRSSSLSRDADLRDAGIEGAGGLVGALDELELGGDLGVGGGAGDGVELRRVGLA